MVGNTSLIPAKEGVAKSIKALHHKDTKAQRKLFCLPGVTQASPKKTLCLRAFVVPFFSGPFATTFFTG